MRQYNSIKELYDDVEKRIKPLISSNNYDKKAALIYLRQNININELKSFYIVAKLSENEKEVIKSKSFDIKLSFDTLMKNFLKHPELTIDDYMNIGKYIKNAQYILKSNDKNLIFFKVKDVIFQIVVKTTKDKKENFITTFHKSSMQQLNKDLKRYEQIKR